jgi:predicted GTPase
MHRRDRIDRIISNRALHSAATTKARATLTTVADKFEQLDRVRQDITQQLPTGPVATGLMEFSFGEQRKETERLRAVLHRIQKRFSRDRIQIGVLGRARQGKSTLLQKLTGLDDTVIPSGNVDHCTGARSVIVNDPAARPPFGVIRFGCIRFPDSR